MYQSIVLMVLLFGLHGYSLGQQIEHEDPTEIPATVWPLDAKSNASTENATSNETSIFSSFKAKSTDEYIDRADVAGFKEKPKVFFLPFWKDIEATHPNAEGEDGDKNVIVIDLDELAASGSGAGGGAGAEIGQSILLGGSGLLAFWYGTRSSIEVIIETTKEIKELGKEKKAVLLAQKQAELKSLSSDERRRLHENMAAILRENQQNKNMAKFDRIFLGMVPAVGATGTGVSAFLQIPLYATIPMAAAGALGMAISGPIISVFSASAAGKHGYRFYKTFAIKRELDKLVGHEINPREVEAYQLLQQRLKLIRTLTATGGASMLGLTVGVPLTIFGGPFGLAVLLPGAIGGIAGSYIQGRKLNYSPQLTWEDKAQIDGKDGLINSIAQAHQEYLLLKKMKSEQRLWYPIGKSAPLPFRTVAKSVACLRRMTNKGEADKISAEETFFTYLKKHNSLEIEAAEITKIDMDKKYTDFLSRHLYRHAMTPDELLIEQEMLAKTVKYEKLLRELLLEESLLNRALSKALSNDESVFLLMNFLVKNRLFLPFAESLMNKKSLKKILLYAGAITKDGKDGKEFHVHANKLVTLMMSDSLLSEPERLKLRERLFKVARDTIFITAKNRIQWRERQLLDFLAARLTTTT